MTSPHQDAPTDEYADLQAALERQRHLLLLTVRDLTDEQAARPAISPPVSLGDLLKETADVETGWLNFVLAGVEGMVIGGRTPGETLRFQLDAGETLVGVLARYTEVASRTDKILATRPDLGASRPLPDVPGIEPGTTWSNRRAVLEVIAETARAAARADVIRRSLDDANVS